MCKLYGIADVVTCRQLLKRTSERERPAEAVLEARAAWPSTSGERSTMRCIGTLPLTRRCYFRNLYFHVPSQRFRLFVTENENLGMYGHNFTDPKEPSAWLALGRCVLPAQDARTKRMQSLPSCLDSERQ